MRSKTRQEREKATGENLQMEYYKVKKRRIDIKRKKIGEGNNFRKKHRRT